MVLVMHLEIYTACKVVTGLMLYVITLLLQNNSMNGIYLRLPLRKKRDLMFARSLLCVYSHYNDGRHKITVCTIYLKKKVCKS